MIEPSQPLAVGLVGCGRIARLFHAAILRDLPQTHLVAFAEPDEANRSEARRVAPKAHVHRDYTELIARSDIEAVVLCLPTDLHAEAAVAAFRHGKHVYLEKPLATSLDEGRRVISAWHESGLVGAIGYHTRLHPLYRQARELLAEGRLGELVAARGVMSSVSRDLPVWKRRRASGGGALLDLASHQIDRVEFLLDDRVEDVFATIRSVLTEDDTALLTLRLRRGLDVQLLATNSAVHEDRIEVYGEAGKLVIDRFGSSRLALVPPEPPGGRTARLAAGLRALVDGAARSSDIVFPRSQPLFRDALRTFALAVRGDGVVAADLQDGYRSLAVVVAAESSVVSGAKIRLESVG